MPNRQKNPRAQFEAVDELLRRWLRERRELLARYTEIVATVDIVQDADALAARQARLCQVLVDYVSAGHFELFHELFNEAEAFADGSGKLAEKLMPAIGDTTEVILAYEEKYAGTVNRVETLPRDLSALGEILETRFELEDQLIAGLHYSHQAQIQAPA
jgi:regulator of sigma D